MRQRLTKRIAAIHHYVRISSLMSAEIENVPTEVAGHKLVVSSEWHRSSSRAYAVSVLLPRTSSFPRQNRIPAKLRYQNGLLHISAESLVSEMNN